MMDDVKVPTRTDLSVVSADGTRLAVRDHGGSGPVLLLMHGASQNLATWTDMAPYFTSHHRVVAMDLRNHGKSADGPWTWSAALDDIDAVMDELGLEDVTLVGHSLGGMLAAMYAAADRRPCRAAVNIDGHGNGRPEMLDREYVDLAAERGAVLRQMAASMWPAQTLSEEEVGHAGQARVAAATSFGMSAAAATEAWERSTVRSPDGRYGIRPSAEQMEELADAIDAADLLDVYRRSRCPLLIFDATRIPDYSDVPEAAAAVLPSWLGEHLAAIQDGIARGLATVAETTPHVRVETVDLTHALVTEDPAGIARIVTGFVHDVPSSGSAR